MTLKECRTLSLNFPERYKLEAKILRGNDKNIPLFVYKLSERKEDGLHFNVVYNSAPLGIGRNVINGIGEWLFI